MYIYALFLFTHLMGGLSTILGKKFQLGFVMDTKHFVTYNIINAFVACVNFLVLNKFTIDMNFITFIYSIVFAMIVITSLVSSIIAYAHVSISLLSLIGACGGIIHPTIFSIFYLKEPPTVSAFIAGGLILIATILPFWQKGSYKISKIGILLCFLSFINAGASTIISRLYAESKAVCDENSYFFMTNLIILGVCLIVALFYSIKDKKLFKINIFTKGQVLNMVARTFISNTNSLLNLIIIVNMNLFTFATLGPSLTLVISGLISRLYFKEPLSKINLIAIILAILAIIINNFNF